MSTVSTNSTMSSLAYEAQTAALGTSEVAQATQSASSSASSSQVAQVAAQTIAALATETAQALTSAVASSLASSSVSVLSSSSSSSSSSSTHTLSLTATSAEQTAETAETNELSVEEVQQAVEEIYLNFANTTVEREKTGKIRSNLCLVLQNGTTDQTVQGLEKVLAKFYSEAPKEHVAIHNLIVPQVKNPIKQLLPMLQKLPNFDYALDLTTKIVLIEGLDKVANMVNTLSPTYLQGLVTDDATCQTRAKSTEEKADSKEQKGS